MLMHDLEAFYTRLLEASVVSGVEELGELIGPGFVQEPRQLNWTLETAVKNRDVKIVKALLSFGCKVDVLNADKQTALHLAVYHGFYDIIDALFSHCLCNANHADSNGLTHFHVACINGSLEIARRFLRDGVDANLRCCRAAGPSAWDSFTPLHFAVEFGKLAIVELLLKSGADPNAADGGGATALHVLCRAVSRRTREASRRAGPAPEPLGQRSELAILGLLARYGGDVNLRDRSGDTAMMSLFRDDYLPSSKYHSFVWEGESKRELLGGFVERKRRIIEALLRANANPNARNNDRETILHRIVGDGKSSRGPRVGSETRFDDALNAALIELLARHGADVDAIDRKGRSPLQIAVSFLNYEAVRVLLDYGADVSWIKLGCPDEEGCFDCCRDRLPSLEATENLITIVDALVARGLQLSGIDNLPVLKFFVHNDANCRYGDPRDEDVLHKLKNLLELGANANIRKALNARSERVYDTSFLEQSTRKRVIRQIYKHLAIIECGSLYLAEEVHSCLRAKIRRLESCLLGFLDTDERLGHDELGRLQEEIRMMKAIELTSGSSLHDVLVRSPQASYPLIRRSDYAAVLYADDFWKHFPNSGGIIRGHFAKSLVRRYVANASAEAFKSLTDALLPDLCCEKIVSYLSNECLFNLCLAASNT